MSTKDQDAFSKIETFKSNSHNLMNEGFKAEAVLKMMNSCADKCQLQYKANGIMDQSDAQVSCLTNCITKANKLAGLNLS